MQDHSIENYDLFSDLKLKQVLDEALMSARSKGLQPIISISLPLSYVAPLALLESLDLKGQPHFFMERPVEDVSVLAFGSLCLDRLNGKERFEKVKLFSKECLESILEHKLIEGAFTGPHFFTACAFSDEVSESDGFDAATVFLPKWHVYNNNGVYGIVFNIQLDAEVEIEALLSEIKQRFDRFQSFDYAGQEQEQEQELGANKKELSAIDLTQCIERSDFVASVEGALTDIAQNSYQKIVLAQKSTFPKPRAVSGVDFLNRLRERFTACYTFSFSDGSERSFIGASPEKLVQIKSNRVLTEAIAGSSSRGKKPSEDARLGVDLLQSDKNLREHNLVINSIIKRLSILGIEAQSDLKPRLLALANVQHLMTKIKGVLPKDTHIMDVVSELHPTPAVGGQPRELAVPRIRELENFGRGLYAGVVGWFNQDSDGEMIVGIRSAQFNSDTVDVFAGAGIVEGSEPEKEKHEIELKYSAILEALMNA